MAKLEEVTVGSTVTGIIGQEPVTIVAVQWFGSNVLEITYKDTQSIPGTQLLLREDEAHIDVMDNSLPWSFDADGNQMKLASEAYRISLAHLFDPYLAVHTSSVEPLPHQISAVYQEMLPKLPLRYVLADDPGAGKTIMTGLFIKELIARGDLKRCMIVAPGSLVEQWQDELFTKFHLRFEILTNDRMESAVTGNIFNEVDYCICRLDKLARNDELQEKLKVSEWDLIVCDEAHKMSATIWGGEVKYTKRFQLGRLLSNVTKNFLLLTATPHNGKEDDFHLFLSLVDPDRFEGTHGTTQQAVDVSDVMRRLVKEELLKFDGTPLFPERIAYTVNYSLSPQEASLYQAVTDYVQEEFNRADKLNSDRKTTVGFALTILQRRLASSPEAIYQSLRRRRERLEHSIVVASIPESDIEIGGDAGKKVLETIEHTFGRMESIWKPVAANEGFEVVRRRLFLDCKDTEARDAVCDAFSKMYQENSSDFPLESKEVEYRDRMVSCYPIHPEVFDRLYGDWATLERFQRTRGVLRLMAAVIHELWMADDASPMIMPGSIPLDVPTVRDELVRHLPDTWNSIIDREVDGKESIPYQKDKNNIRYGRFLAARRVARTVMLGSAPSTSALRDQGIRGLETSRILLGTVQPAENIADFKDALNTLHGSLSYLYNNPNGNRFWYDTKPTLRKTAEDRASQISAADVDIEIEGRLKKLRRESPFAGIHTCPASSNDVPDEQAVRLVILRTKDTYRRNTEKSKAMDAVNDILNNRGTAPRVYRNMLAFVAPDFDKIGSLQQEVKRYIAWTSIMSDKEDLNLDGQQVRETQNNLNRSNDTVELRLKETFCWLLVPYIDQYEDMKTIRWEINDLGGGTDSIVSKAAKKMIQGEQIITKWAPALLQMCLDDLLWRDSNDIQVKKLWEYLSTYCYLPRLSSYSVLEETICGGLASDEYFGLAAAYSNERYVDLKWNQNVFGFNQTDLLVKPNIAKAQIRKEAEEKEKTEFQDNQFAENPGDKRPGGAGLSGSSSQSGSGTQSETGGSTEPVSSKHFFMSAPVDPVRVNKVISTYVDEIIRHLMQVDGATVELRLDVDVQVPGGIPSTTIRTVSENCKTLKITDFGFDN